MSFERFPNLRDCKLGYAALVLCCTGMVLAVFDHIVLGLPAWISMLMLVVDMLLLQKTLQVITRQDREVSLGDAWSMLRPADRQVGVVWPKGPALDILARVIEQAQMLRPNGFCIDLSNLGPDEYDAVVDYFDRVRHRSWKAAPGIPSRRRMAAQSALNDEAWGTIGDLLYLHDERKVALRVV